jgi:hypothetical protein
LAKKAQKGIYREVCGESHLCKWYKRGKARVLVDTATLEVVAHNPLPILAAVGLAKAAYSGYQAVKATGVLDKKAEKKETPNTQRIIHDSLDKPNKRLADEWNEKIYKGEM